MALLSTRTQQTFSGDTQQEALDAPGAAGLQDEAVTQPLRCQGDLSRAEQPVTNSS